MKHLIGTLIVIFGLLFAASAMEGCSTSGAKDTRFVQSVAVQYAVAKYLEGTDNPAESAAKAVEIADYALRVLEDGEIAAIPRLESHIQSKVNWGTMEPSDRILAMALVQQVRIRLEEVVGGREVSEDRMVVVRHVFDNVRQAAALYMETSQ